MLEGRSEVGRLVQLDGIRGLAAIAVVVYHALPWPVYFPEGRIAVWVFLVLSGFLITGILLRARDRGGDRTRAWMAFYTRRALRIFPIYYLALAVVVALDLSQARSNWVWYATYTTNVPNLWGVIKDGALVHFWSLAVEEQFYLIWPFVVLLTPPHRLRTVMAAMVATGLVSGAVLAWAWPDPRAALHASPTCVLGLGMGALLAHDRHSGQPSARWPTTCLMVGLAAWTAYVMLFAVGWGRALRISVEPAAWTFLSVWLIARAADGFDGPAGRLLASKPLVALGTISYGVYIYHLPILFGFSELWPGIARMPLAHFAAGLATTLIVAAASWHWIEAPLLKLKDRLPTTEDATAQPRIQAEEPAHLLDPRPEERNRACEAALGPADG